MSAKCKLRHMQCSKSIAIYWGISSCTSLGGRSRIVATLNVAGGEIWKALCVTCGTSVERTAAESPTPVQFDFVHGDL
jgi:hypothetical protein